MKSRSSHLTGRRTLGLALAFALVFAEPPVGAAQPAHGSCWGNCGEHDELSGCSCDSDCQVRGDCCEDKHELCFFSGVFPHCALADGLSHAAVWGTDLGFSYEHRGQLEILFGDTWTSQSAPFCDWGGAQWPQDDALATLPITRPSWLPTGPTTAPLTTCPVPDYVTDEWFSFAPVTVDKDGSDLPMAEGITPAAGWSDGDRAFTWVASLAYQGCSYDSQCTQSAICVSGGCLDPASPDPDPYLRSVEIAYRPSEGDPTRYVSGHTYFTNKFQIPSIVTVTRFDPDAPGNNDYQRGTETLLLLGRPGVGGVNGAAVPFLAYQRLGELRPGSDGRIAWRPRYFAGLVDGNPTWTTEEANAVPLYEDEINFPSFTELAWIAPIRKWVMLYGGDLPSRTEPYDEPRHGAIHVRMADHPWGPFGEPVPFLLREVAASFMACDDSPGTGDWQYDVDALLEWSWQLNCLDEVPVCGPWDLPEAPGVGGRLYSPNVIESWTHDAASTIYPRSAQVYFNVSTAEPYQVMLGSARMELPWEHVAYGLPIHLRGVTGQLIDAGGSSAAYSRQPDDLDTHFQLFHADQPITPGYVTHGQRVLLRARDGRYLRRSGSRVKLESTVVADSEWVVERLSGSGMVAINRDLVRLRSATASRRLKLKSEGLRVYTGGGSTSNWILSWGCRSGDDCSPSR